MLVHHNIKFRAAISYFRRLDTEDKIREAALRTIDELFEMYQCGMIPAGDILRIYYTLE